MTYRKATIRPYRAEDGSLLFTLAKSTFGEQSAWSDEKALARLDRGTVFVAEVEGEPAGYVALELDAETVRVEQLLVSTRHVHEGIGRQLVDYAEGFAIAQGAKRLQIVVEPDNRRALDFYGRRSFVPAGEDVLELVLPQR